MSARVVFTPAVLTHIKALLKQPGYSQHQIARETGLSQSGISMALSRQRDRIIVLKRKTLFRRFIDRVGGILGHEKKSKARSSGSEGWNKI